MLAGAGLAGRVCIGALQLVRARNTPTVVPEYAYAWFMEHLKSEERQTQLKAKKKMRRRCVL